MKKKVLTVDDSRTIRNMLLVTLNNAGFETVQAEDGVEGLEVLEDANPDVIVLPPLFSHTGAPATPRRRPAGSSSCM